MGCDRNARGKLLKRNGGGDRTRTCKPLRAAVFKTAALPIMRPLRDWQQNYTAGIDALKRGGSSDQFTPRLSEVNPKGK